jgi:hypothetical protein
MLELMIAISDLMLSFFAVLILLTINAIIGWAFTVLWGFKSLDDKVSFPLLMIWEPVFVLYLIHWLEEKINDK